MKVYNKLKLLQAVSHPLGYVADVAQRILELAGHDTAGALVGCVGNTAAGAYSGFVIGGPQGALVGGALGLGVWYVDSPSLVICVMKFVEFVT